MNESGSQFLLLIFPYSYVQAFSILMLYCFILVTQKDHILFVYRCFTQPWILFLLRRSVLINWQRTLECTAKTIYLSRCLWQALSHTIGPGTHRHGQKSNNSRLPYDHKHKFPMLTVTHDLIIKWYKAFVYIAVEQRTLLYQTTSVLYLNV